MGEGEGERERESCVHHGCSFEPIIMRVSYPVGHIIIGS